MQRAHSRSAARTGSATSPRATPAAAGLHALHVVAGVVIIALIAIDAAKYRELHRVELIGVYWHFVDVVRIFLFPLLYIAK